MMNGGAVPKRAAIDCRISDDREGRGLGIARQERELREVCRPKGSKSSECSATTTSRPAGTPRSPVRATRHCWKPSRAGKSMSSSCGTSTGSVAGPSNRRPSTTSPTRLNVLRLVTRGEDFNLHESLVLPRVKAAIAAEESRKLSSRIRSKHAELLEQEHRAAGPVGSG